MAEATLFDEIETPSAPLDLPLAHPYARYGLAVAMVQSRLKFDELNKANLRDALAYSIEIGLEHFRMRTGDNPANTRLLRFSEIKMDELQAEATLVQSSGLAAKGIYIFPTVVTTDGNAKDTWKNAIDVVKKLRDGNSFDDREKFSRSFAPTTAKINNGTASQTEPKGSLLEVACALITTLTPLKPAAWPGPSTPNTVIIPDLPLEELRDFVSLFQQMSGTKLDGDLMHAQLKEVKPFDESKPKRVSKKPAKAAIIKSEFRRPRLHSGNYPFAPRDAGTFGAVGLLGAIGRWAHEAKESAWATRVLEAIAGQPLYIVSYDKISQVRFGHHIVGLALNGELSKMVDALWRETKLYADLDSAMIRRDTPAYQLFYLQTSRFLQTFSKPAFADFLAARAEYPSELRPLFEEYFMSQNIPIELVVSARMLGQHLNYTAYRAANEDVAENAKNRRDTVRKAKAKIIVEFESAIMSAKLPEDMTYRLSERSGRLTYGELPPEATAFMDATNCGQIDLPRAKHLLIAYLRLRPQKAENTDVSDESTSTNAVTSDNEMAKSVMNGAEF